MKGNIDERAIQLALYITEHRATVRSAAGAFGVSKSTVHKDVTCRLNGSTPALPPGAEGAGGPTRPSGTCGAGAATRLKYSRG